MFKGKKVIAIGERDGVPGPAIAECLDAVFPAIPYCVDLIGGPFLTTDEKRLVAFRPKKK